MYKYYVKLCVYPYTCYGWGLTDKGVQPVKKMELFTERADAEYLSRQVPCSKIYFKKDPAFTKPATTVEKAKNTQEEEAYW